MSTYIMSDIHGASNKFYSMLKKINIDFEKDILIIDGDILDRNKGSLKLFFEIYEMQQNYGSDQLIILKGNHELFLSRYIKGELSEALYSAFGGDTTIPEVSKLKAEEKTELSDILDSLPIYKMVYSEKRGEDILVVHTGPLPQFITEYREMDDIDILDAIQKSVAFDEYKFLINAYIQAEAPAYVRQNLACTLCVGHVPTSRIIDVQTPIVVEMPGKKVILIDCGAGHGERLGCLRIDDEAVFYV